MNQSAINRLIKTAHDAGAAPDQITRFLSAGYAPQPVQWRLHAMARAADRPDGPDRIALAGDRGGAKSHTVMSQVAIDDCQRFPGLDVLYLRKVGKAASKALEQLRDKTFLPIAHGYNRNEGIIRFDNGSTMIVGHFKDDRDVDNFVGIEYDDMVIEEATQLSESKIDRLLGSLRSSKVAEDGRVWRPRAYMPANPGGIGHGWYKRRYILPHRKGERGRYQTVEMSWRDNIFLDAGYIDYLNSLKGVLRRMWRDGDWDVGAGQFFTNWSYDHHIIEGMDVKGHWPVWMSFDYGYSHPTAVYWHTAFDGKIYTFAEHVESRWLPKQHAEEMKRICAKFGREAHRMKIVAGRDAFTVTKDREAKSIADQYAEEGLYLTPANVDRISGAAEMLNRLGDPLEGVEPSWFITADCPRLIACLPELQSDPNRPEDVLKVDADEAGENGDDPYDAVRYGLMERPLRKSGFQVRPG